MNTPVIKKKSVTKKLLVVGFQEVALSNVISFLNHCEIPNARALVKEGIQVEEISQILLKAHGLQTNTCQYTQLQVDPIWNGLALDLIMSNRDQDLWIWKDKNALSLLEYWKSLDSTLSFILVYNSPQKLFEELTEAETLVDANILEEAIHDWMLYNRELLNFYYRNQDRCILLDSDQVATISDTKLLEVGKEIGIDINNKNLNLQVIQKTFDTNKLNDNLYMSLINNLANHYPEALALYSELQSSANLPCLHSYKNDISAQDALVSYAQMKKNTAQQTIALKKYEHIIERIEVQLKASEESHKTLGEENELLLAQLHILQEELESKFHAAQKLEISLQEKEKALALQEQERQQITERIEAQLKASEESHKTLGEENELLLAQLHMVQEELEVQYLKNVQQKPSLQKYYGAADRVRAQLSYRLGAKMVENSKSLSGIIKLPFILYAETQKYRLELSKRGKLPPIHKYADAYEAEKLKKHLSYRLGQAMIENTRSPLGFIKLPFALLAAEKAYKKERKNVSK